MARATTKTLKQKTTEPKPKKTAQIGPLVTGVITFSRSLQVSEGLLYAGRGWPEITSLQPLPVVKKGVRGQTSQAKTDSGAAGDSNPQSVDFACIPPGCDTVVISFGLCVLANSRHPHSCDNPAVAQAYADYATLYGLSDGYDELAARYLANLANGRFAWRNRFQTDAARVRVDFAGETLVFDPLALPLDRVPNLSEMAQALQVGDRDGLNRLIKGFAAGLKEPGQPFTLEVRWEAQMREASEVFPSQEYILEENKKEGEHSRVYAAIPTSWSGRTVNQASLHSQKIGAALRHIDDWFPKAATAGRVIAVNPYGGVQETGEVARPPKDSGQSFYDLRDSHERLMAEVDLRPIGPGAHFFMADLVRGGVFGGDYVINQKVGQAPEEQA